MAGCYKVGDCVIFGGEKFEVTKIINRTAIEVEPALSELEKAVMEATNEEEKWQS
jgi:hypothetical protein